MEDSSTLRAAFKANALTEEDHRVIADALGRLERALRTPGEALQSPDMVRDYFKLRLGALPYEVFCTAYLDAQHRVIDLQETFRGTLAQTSVYPREVVRESLARNAAAVIFVHNHPSGIVEPSTADQALTRVLKDALTLVDVRVLDHVIIGGTSSMSFSERGLL